MARRVTGARAGVCVSVSRETAERLHRRMLGSWVRDLVRATLWRRHEHELVKRIEFENPQLQVADPQAEGGDRWVEVHRLQEPVRAGVTSRTGRPGLVPNLQSPMKKRCRGPSALEVLPGKPADWSLQHFEAVPRGRGYSATGSKDPGLPRTKVRGLLAWRTGEIRGRPNAYSDRRFWLHEMAQGLRSAERRGAETRKLIPLSQLPVQFRDR